MSTSNRSPFPARATPLILAIEPDPDQASSVRRAVRSLATVDLVLVDSTRAALTQLAEGVPELILLSALLAPADEAALAAHLRARQDASHVEMITIPLLDLPPRREEKRRGLFGVFKRGKSRDEDQGRVSPRVFANEIKAHLERVREAHANAPARAIETIVSEPAHIIERDAAPELAMDRSAAETDTAEAAPVEPIAPIEPGHMVVEPRRVILGSDRVPGLPLAELLAHASERSVVADLPAALFVMRRLLAAFGSLHATAVARVVVDAERVIVTPRAEVLGVASPFPDSAREALEEDDGPIALAAIGAIGLSIMLGRRVDFSEPMPARSDVLAEVADVAAIRAGDVFSTVLRSWFERAFAADARRAFLDFSDAAAALDQVERSGCAASRPALKAFLKNLALENFDTPEVAEIEAARIRSQRARQIERRRQIVQPAIFVEPTETKTVQDPFVWSKPVAPETVLATVPDPPYHPAELLADAIDAAAPSTLDPALAIEQAAMFRTESVAEAAPALPRDEREYVAEEPLRTASEPLDLPAFAEQLDQSFAASPATDAIAGAAIPSMPEPTEDIVQDTVSSPVATWADPIEAQHVADRPTMDISAVAEAVETQPAPETPEEIQGPAEDQSSAAPSRGASLLSLFRSFRARRSDEAHPEPAHESVVPEQHEPQAPLQAAIEPLDLPAFAEQLDESFARPLATEAIGKATSPATPEPTENVAPDTAYSPAALWSNPIEPPPVADQPTMEIGPAAHEAARPRDEDAIQEPLQTAIFASRSVLGLETHGDVSEPIQTESLAESEELERAADEPSSSVPGRGASLLGVFRSFRARHASHGRPEAPHDTVAQEPQETQEPLHAAVEPLDLPAFAERRDESFTQPLAAETVAQAAAPSMQESTEHVEEPLQTAIFASRSVLGLETPGHVGEPVDTRPSSETPEEIERRAEDESSGAPGRGASLLGLFRSFRARRSGEQHPEPALGSVVPEPNEPRESPQPAIEPLDLSALAQRLNESFTESLATEAVAEAAAPSTPEPVADIAPHLVYSPTAGWTDPSEPPPVADQPTVEIDADAIEPLHAAEPPTMEVAAASEDATPGNDEDAIQEPLQTAIFASRSTLGLETRGNVGEPVQMEPLAETSGETSEAIERPAEEPSSGAPGRGGSLLSLFRSFRGRRAGEEHPELPHETMAPEPHETLEPPQPDLERRDLSALAERLDESFAEPAAHETVTEPAAASMPEPPADFAPDTVDSPTALWAEPQQVAEQPTMESGDADEAAAWLRDEWEQRPAAEIVAQPQAIEVAEEWATPSVPDATEEVARDRTASSAPIWPDPIEPQRAAELPNMAFAAAAEETVPPALPPPVLAPPPVLVAPPAITPERTKPEAPKIKGPITRRATSPERRRRWTRAAAAILVAAVLVTGARAYYFRATIPGTLHVESTPKGSEVFVDGAKRGSTPLTLQLPAGSHVVELRRKGSTRQFTLDVGPGAELSQRVDWSNVKPTGSLAITSEPSGANIIVDGKKRGVTPMTISDLPTGSHTVVLDGKEGSVRRTVVIEAGGEARLDESIFSGWIAVFAPFELKISEGRRLVGTTESGRIIMPAGRHELVLTNASLGYRETRVLDVNPGQTTSVTIEAADGIVRVNAPPGTEVSIDGQRVGVTPLGDLRVPIGSREIVFKHPQFGQQRVVTDVGHSAPVDLTADFSKR